MAEIIKYKDGNVLYQIRHDIREIPNGKTFGNTSIDSSRTHLNYSLVDRGKTAKEINQYRKELEKEIHIYNRKDIVHAVEIVIQCPSDCPENEHESFFKASFDYIVSTLPMGERCVLVAEVHRDERYSTPDGTCISKDHLHLIYVPAVPDTKVHYKPQSKQERKSGKPPETYKYKMCADVLTKRSKLKQFHPNLQKHLIDAGITATVFSKADDGKKVIPLSVSQLKEITAQTGMVIDKPLTIDTLVNIIKENQQLKEHFKEIETTNTWGSQHSGWNTINGGNNSWKKENTIEY